MTNKRIFPLIAASIFTLLLTTQHPSAWADQNTKPTPKAVEETKPTEQTRDVADGVIVPDYRDDRSTPQALVESYYNAINRKEYGRAYSYLEQSHREPDFQKFVNGYEKTKSVKVAVREVEPDPGAGQIYWSLPIAIESESERGHKEVFGGCYTVHISNPSMQEGPSFIPMQIMSGTLTKSTLNLEDSVPEACEAP